MEVNTIVTRLYARFDVNLLERKVPRLESRRVSPSYGCSLTIFLFVRLDEDRLGEVSPVLARLFLQSIFITVDISIREGRLFCDCLCDNGPLYNGQVSTVFPTWYGFPLASCANLHLGRHTMSSPQRDCVTR